MADLLTSRVTITYPFAQVGINNVGLGEFFKEFSLAIQNFIKYV